MDTSQIIVALIIIGIILETLIQFFSNKKYMLNTFGINEGNIYREVTHYQNMSLILIAIFIVLLIIFSVFDIFIECINLFIIGFVLSSLAYKVAIFGAVRRVYYDIQQRLLNYSLIALFSAFLILIFQITNSILIHFISILVFIIIILLHLNEFYIYYKMHKFM